MNRPLWLVLLCFSVATLLAQDPAINSRDGVAIQGYDIVGYFGEGPQKGNPLYVGEYRGIRFWFSTLENKELFQNDPKKYLPQYGGWCAYAMGVSGEKVRVDPKTYKILNGRLYLFYKVPFNNTLKKWNEDESNLLVKADRHWRKQQIPMDHE